MAKRSATQEGIVAMKPFGTIANSGTIRFERLLPGPTERVWDYLTKPDLLATWLAQGEIQLHVGGYVELKFGRPEGSAVTNSVISGVVTHCHPPDSLSYYWTDAATISNVVFELEKRGSEVLLLLTHANVPKSQASACSAGWHARLDILAEQLNNRTPSSLPALFESLVPHYEQ
jgi:uncharacterized protein YndB with AHSA1/START domain